MAEISHLEVKQAHIFRFLEETGAKAHSACPRCKSKDWDIAGRDPSRIIIRIDPSRLANISENFKGYQLTFECDNCGYGELFSFGPFLRWFAKNMEALVDG